MACHPQAGTPEPLGEIAADLTAIPAGVYCAVFRVEGAHTVVRSLDVMPGTSGTYALKTLPTGDVAVSAQAFNLACADVTPDSVPTWVADAVAAKLRPAVVTPVSLVFRRDGRLSIMVTFEDTSCDDGGCADDDGAAGTGGTAGNDGGSTGGSGGGAGDDGGAAGAGGGAGGVAGSAGGTSGAGGGTTVGGIINQDVVWDAAGSPYRLEREVQVASTATLTIGAGAHVEGNGFAITTWGTLTVTGQLGNLVTFHDVQLNPGGSSTRSAVVMIDHAVIDGGRLWYATGGGYGSLKLTASVVRDLDAGTTVYLWYPQAASTVEGNVFVRSGGISVGTQGVPVSIKNNVFYKPTTPFAIENWASYGGVFTTVTRNTFLDTTAVALQLPKDYTSAAMDARENYWSTTDPAVIETMIVDQNDDLRRASVIPFEPFLSGPDPATPDYAPWVN